MRDFGAIRRAVVAGVVGIGAVTAAQARDCGAESTQAAMNECAQREFQSADAGLNAAYRRLVARVDQTEVRQLLTAAQRSWVVFRDAECAFSASGVQGGSVYPMIMSMCRTGLTKARTEDVSRYLACKEGELDCPAPAR